MERQGNIYSGFSDISNQLVISEIRINDISNWITSLIEWLISEMELDLSEIWFSDIVNSNSWYQKLYLEIWNSNWLYL